MQWLELGKEIVKLGCPLLGAVVAGTPSGHIADELCNLFINLEGNMYPVTPELPGILTNAIKADPDASTKLQDLQKTHGDELAQSVSSAAINVMGKLVNQQ